MGKHTKLVPRYGEIALASALEAELEPGSGCSYIHIPKELVTAMEEFVELALNAADEIPAVYMMALTELNTRMMKLRTREIVALRNFAQVLASNVGNAQTPVEDFIAGLPELYVRRAKSDNALTPDEIEGRFEDMREFYNDAIAITKRFKVQYRAEVEESVAQ